jgi:hypothetical protein
MGYKTDSAKSLNMDHLLSIGLIWTTYGLKHLKPGPISFNEVALQSALLKAAEEGYFTRDAKFTNPIYYSGVFVWLDLDDDGESYSLRTLITEPIEAAEDKWVHSILPISGQIQQGAFKIRSDPHSQTLTTTFHPYQRVYTKIISTSARDIDGNWYDLDENMAETLVISDDLERLMAVNELRRLSCTKDRTTIRLTINGIAVFTYTNPCGTGRFHVDCCITILYWLSEDGTHLKTYTIDRQNHLMRLYEYEFESPVIKFGYSIFVCCDGSVWYVMVDEYTKIDQVELQKSRKSAVNQ